MKRIGVIVIAALICALLVSACGLIQPRYPITNTDFVSTMERLGYSVEDVTDMTDLTTEVSLIAVDSTGSYQIEFHYFETTVQANTTFSQMRAFAENVGGASSTSSANGNNWASYSKTVAGAYYNVYRVETTVTFVQAPSEFRDEIREALTELRDAAS